MIEFLTSLLVVALPITAIIVLNYTGTAAETGPNNHTGCVAYQGSLRVKSETFMDTLLDQDSQDYREKEDKYGGMVSGPPFDALILNQYGI